MIKVPNIQGSPESTPKKYIGIHSDDSYYYFFETEKEKENFYAGIPNDNSGKKAEIEQRAEKLFDKALADNWYSRFDVQFYAKEGEQTAIDLLIYYDYLWNVIEENFENEVYDFKLPEYGEG